ncbi:hypothetical protein E2I00_000112, partial [Balaenoptera physalus]
CGCGLAQSGFFFKNQEYICTQDYQQLYGTRCDSCRDFITGEVISALGRTYHPKCFVCSLCRKPFPIGDKVTFSGKECLCQTCSQSMTSSKPIKIRGPSRIPTELINIIQNDSKAGMQDHSAMADAAKATRQQWDHVIRSRSSVATITTISTTTTTIFTITTTIIMSTTITNTTVTTANID